MSLQRRIFGSSAAGGPPVQSATVEASGSDDTAAFASAVESLTTKAIADGSYYGEIWLAPGIKLTSGFDTSQGGSAQIALPLIDTAGPKMTLVLRALRSGAAGWHWHQVVSQPCVIFSTKTGSGQDSIIGGPIGSWSDPNGSNNGNFTNYHLVLDGVSLGNVHNSGMMYVDGRHVAELNAVNGLGLLSDRWPAAASSSLVTNSNGVGIYMPAGNNNDNDGIDNLVVFDVYYAVAFADHFFAPRLKTIYCHTGAYMADDSGGDPHGAMIDYWSCEGGNTVMEVTSSPGSFPIKIGRIDAEVQSGTDFLDAANRLYGEIGWAEVTGRNPTTNGAVNVDITNEHQPRGPQTTPADTSKSAAVPAASTNLKNPFSRPAFVQISGGTGVAVTVDGQSWPTSMAIPLRPQSVINLGAYTGTPPTWKWTVL